MAGATEIGRATAVVLHQHSMMLRTSSNGRPVTRLGYVGAARHRRVMWCWLSATGSPTERWQARVAARVSIFAYQNSS
jgi:hypothetical protein